jgi:hypothetical protein
MKRKATNKGIRKAIREVIQETQIETNHPMVEQGEMSDTYSRASFKPTPRETEISGVFGRYSEDIPPSVIRYIRKNPKSIIKNLYDVYGEKIYDYIPTKPEQ